MSDLGVLQDVYLDPAVEKELQDRLSRIEGHVRGVKRMLGEHASCEDLLLQLSAVRAAINNPVKKRPPSRQIWRPRSKWPDNWCCAISVDW